MNTAIGAGAMIVASLVGPRILAAAPVRVLMLGAILCAVFALILFPFVIGFFGWTLLRIVIGFGAGAGYLAVEYWVTSLAPAERRGREVGLYALAVASGMSTGPALIWITGVKGWAPFAVCAGVAALSLIGLLLAWRAVPEVRSAPRRGGVLAFFRTDPSLLWGVVLFGVIEVGAFGLLWAWAEDAGLSEVRTIGVIVAVAIGTLTLQPFFGMAIDRAPGRPLLIGAACSCIAAPLAAIALTDAPLALYATMFLWGGLSGGLYSVSLATISWRYAGDDLAAANAAMVVAYGIGGLIGPAAVGAAMEAAGPIGMNLLIAAMAAVYILLLARRRGIRRQIDKAD